MFLFLLTTPFSLPFDTPYKIHSQFIIIGIRKGRREFHPHLDWDGFSLI